MTILHGDEARQRDAVWSRVDRGFFVGSRRGDFIGHIDVTPEGRYRAVDSRSRVIDDFADLHAAMAALETTGSQDPEGGGSRGR
ncbi:hypothetical protein [Homoserinibacter sp. YIM 151385]|uniref:hypothetical protein n=1 Tax=Homoserinibacter sp. YIM 151385 TaxID=2985506 RepID=UPI0022EFF092|nr:hypothetical protein [Homoserinibacter sp. YIM 151385]WBU37493.1 hypothetical protein OF852_11290 [Homoserinibacter sp. YIM 151385]